MRKFLLLKILVGLVVLSCETKKTNESTSTTDTMSTITDSVTTQGKKVVSKPLSFEEYLALFKTEELPIVFKSDSTEEIYNSNPGHANVSKEPYAGNWQPLFRITPTQDYEMLITLVPTDIGTPLLLTYSPEGNKIDSLLLFKEPGGDEGYSRVETVSLNKDRSITAVYKTTTYKVDAEGNTIKSSVKEEAAEEKFQIGADGKIQKISK